MRTLSLLVVAAAVLPTAALADQRELYLQLELAPAWSSTKDPVDGSTSLFQLGGGAELSALYGVTNSLHLGATFSLGGAFNLAFPNKTMVIDAAGSTASGTLYEDLLLASLAAAASYRLDTGSNFAPIARLELGGAYLRYPNAQFNPRNTSIGVSEPTLDQFALTARVLVAIEWRFANHWVASVGVAARGYLGFDFAPAATSVELQVPVSLGFIWW